MPRLFHNGSPRISCDDPCHKRRGSAGGEDFAVAVGTPVFAPVAGTYRFRSAGTGGWTITVVPADSRLRGWVLEVMHLSRSAGLVLGGASRYYPEGALIGYSGGRRGAPGAGSSNGPHTHEHAIIHGRRGGIRAAMALAVAIVNPPRPTRTGGTAMLYLHTKDRGGTANLWALINTATGKRKQTRSQAVANDWAASFGAAQTVPVARFTEAIEIVTELASTTDSSEPVDLTPVTTRLDGLAEQIDQLPTTYVGQPKGGVS